MVPPDQGFEADEPGGLQIHDRLVVQDELLLVHGPAQIGLELETCDDRGVHP